MSREFDHIIRHESRDVFDRQFITYRSAIIEYPKAVVSKPKELKLALKELDDEMSDGASI